MNKKIFFVITIICMLLCSTIVFANNETIEAILNKSISITYNNEIKEFSDVNGTIVYPISYEGTTYLPVRAISALFEIPVEWDGLNNKVILDKGELNKNTVKSIDTFIKGTNENIKPILNKAIQIEYKEKIESFTDVNGKLVFPLSYNGTTYLPVRAISNLYGAKINWIGEENKITIEKENKIANITDVTLKVIDDVLCTEIITDLPIKNYNVYPLIEGKITAEPYLNVRENTNTTAKIIAKIPDETIITVKEVVKGENKDIWYKISYENQTGYISADYVETTSARLVVDLNETKFATNTQTKEINYEDVKTIRFGVQENNVNRIVLDMTKISDYKVVQNENATNIYIALAEDFELVADSNEKDYVLIASTEDKIYLPDSEKDVSGDNENNRENDDSSGDIVNSESGDISASGELIASGDNAETDKPSGDNIRENENSGDNKENEVEKEEQKPSINIEKLAKVNSVTYSSSTDKTKINITGNYEYEKFVLHNPERLVIDIKGALLNVDGPTEITPKNKNIKQIRFSQNEVDKVRVVFDLVNEVDYEITEKSKYLEVLIEEPAYRNIKYEANKNYATLTLLNVKKKVFDASETAKYNRYSISYSSSKFDSGKATLEINDDFVEEIKITASKIIIDGIDKMDYEMKQDGDNVVIKISPKGTTKKENTDGDFVILLDAGHGGSDPGACHNGGKTLEEQEKTYTLKIMLKLMELLEDTKGIEVRASRTTDVFIDREGRIDYVLDNEDADMLVSIHINSLANKAYKGTMVLYYNKPNEKEDSGITSKEIALLVKDNLVEDLDLVDRGVVSRNDLWILEQNAAGKISETVGEIRPVTNLPAILCELCFISNEEDFAKLQTEEFQEGAALAIYNGILAAKEQMGK